MLVENLSVPSDRRVWQECLALRKAGYNVTVRAAPRGHEARPHPLRAGRRDQHSPLRPPPPAGGGAAGYLRRYASACWQTRRLALRLHHRRSFDVVHAANPPDLLLPALRELRRGGTRFVFDHHDLVPELYRSRFDRRRERSTASYGDWKASASAWRTSSNRRTSRTAGSRSSAGGRLNRTSSSCGTPPSGSARTPQLEPSLKRGREHLPPTWESWAPRTASITLCARSLSARAAATGMRYSSAPAMVPGKVDGWPEVLGLNDGVGFAGWADNELGGGCSRRPTSGQMYPTGEAH